MQSLKTSKSNTKVPSILADEAVPKRGMVLPFTPLAMSFDSVNYCVHMPSVRIYSSRFSILKLNIKNLYKVLFFLHYVLGHILFENNQLKTLEYSHV